MFQVEHKSRETIARYSEYKLAYTARILVSCVDLGSPYNLPYTKQC